MWQRVLGIAPRSPFTPLERRVLAELQQHLSPEAGRLLAEQLRRITLVRRMMDSREILCYPKTRGRIYRDPGITFPNDRTELRLATIKFQAPPLPDEWTADFFLVQGYFFSIVLSPAAKRIQKAESIEIKSVKIRHDPMQKPDTPDAPGGAADPQQLSGWLREWAQRYQVSRATRRLSPEQRARALQEIPSKLPDDYLELVEQCDGLLVEDCAILGLSEVYDVVLPDGSYYLLADCHGEGALGVRAEAADGIVWYLDRGGADPVEAGPSFRAAVERFCISGTAASR